MGARAMSVGLVIAAILCVAPAAGQVSGGDPNAALAVVDEAFAARRAGNGPDDVPDRLLAASVRQAIEQLSGRFDPFVGARRGSIDRFQVRLAPDQSGSGEGVRVQVAVKSGDDVRLLDLLVGPPDDGQAPQIARIAGKGWQVGEGAGTAASASPPEPTGADGLSEAEKARLAAEDDGAAPGPSEDMLALPFLDEFDGPDLQPHWTVLNADRDRFVADDGEIYVIASGGTAAIDNPDTANIFQLGPPLPDVDFDMTVDARLEAKTGYEGVWLGLRTDASDYLMAGVSTFTKGCGTALYLEIRNLRAPGPEAEPMATGFSENLFDGAVADNICGGGRDYGDAILAALETSGFTLTLSRRGFRYTASLTLDLPDADGEPGGPRTITTPAVSRPALFGRPAVLLGQSSRARGGQSAALFDKISIEAAVPRPTGN
ncbi:hypothetical protein [Amorphus orientalis]|uniref:Uncharacterized protein n=1 Tax=Amorphus orientalis TaxID=649198 RepID=A0AAE4AS61_9HYPH|nr:hypothetical protein [Amorphus orientalis]MDQ0314685.1 hypothetical protein [Amorphus orientalis]